VISFNFSPPQPRTVYRFVVRFIGDFARER
jgi:hypothetical protein